MPPTRFPWRRPARYDHAFHRRISRYYSTRAMRRQRRITSKTPTLHQLIRNSCCRSIAFGAREWVVHSARSNGVVGRNVICHCPNNQRTTKKARSSSEPFSNTLCGATCNTVDIQGKQKFLSRGSFHHLPEDWNQRMRMHSNSVLGPSEGIQVSASSFSHLLWD